MAKPLKNAKNTPLRSVLIFIQTKIKIYSKIQRFQRYEDTKNDATMQQRNEDTKKQRFKEKEKNL